MNKEFGYNSTSGGDVFVMDDETKQKISKALIGNKNNLGHACSEEAKRKISEAQKGRKFTEDHKQKLSEAVKNRHVACSEEKKEKIRASSHKRKVYCEELDIVFESVQECSRQLNIEATNISKLCNGRGKTLKGYHLRYYEEENNMANA